MDELGAELDRMRKAVVAHGENAAADAIACFDDPHTESARLELAHRGEARDARANDSNVT
jgi:hypothetical protein